MPTLEIGEIMPVEDRRPRRADAPAVRDPSERQRGMRKGAIGRLVDGIWRAGCYGGCCVVAALGLTFFPGWARGGGMPYELLERLRETRLEIGGGKVDVVFAPSESALSREPILAWIGGGARAVSAYYGRLPVERVRVLVIPSAGSRVGHATTFGYRGAAIKVSVGSKTPANAFADDWVMTHEMVHLALPVLAGEHDWLGEGLATYVEPLGRAQAGQIPAEAVWADLVWGLPKGVPQPGDRGLDHTPTWGRKYWGGALFCLLADIEIRERTGNRKGLQDALRAVVAAGGNVEARWPIVRALETGDRATGVPVLLELYARMKATPVSVDLEDLWAKLGVRGEGRQLVLDDSAPLAAIRRAIVTGAADRDVKRGGPTPSGTDRCRFDQQSPHRVRFAKTATALRP